MLIAVAATWAYQGGRMQMSTTTRRTQQTTNDAKEIKGAWSEKTGTDPDNSVKGYVRYCMSTLWADDVSAP